MFPLSEKMKVLNLIRKEKDRVLNELAKICGQNKSSIREIVKKEKEIPASFAFAPKVAATEHDQCLIKTEKALLNLWLDGGQKTRSDRGQRVTPESAEPKKTSARVPWNE